MDIKTIDNFLNKEHLEEILRIKIDFPEKNGIKVYHNKITKNDETYAECIPEKFLKELNKKYHNVAIGILRELSPKKETLYDFSEFHLIITGPNAKFPIHDDTADKLLSGVIYIKPENSSGTNFYKNKKGDGKQVINWKVNRGIFFARKEQETWHSYQGDEKNFRVVLVYNLMTNNLRKVAEVENKNYFLSKIRNIINPYIYKYFKKII